MDTVAPGRIEILGVPVDCVDMDGALRTIDAMLKVPKPHRIIAVNPEKIIKADTDPVLKAFLQSSDLLIPDGIGVVLAARILGLGRMGRVAGADLMPKICELASRRGQSIFLFGASAEVNDLAAKVLKQRLPELVIAGQQHGYINQTDWPKVVQRINDSSANILFIALGSPRQELWMDENLGKLNVRVCQGIGGTLDVLAGKVKRAPRFFRRLHMEWLYRLLSQPSRLLRQTALPRFVFRVVRHRLSS